jgi:ferredoxin-NADP reductase
MPYRQRLGLQLGDNLSLWVADEGQRMDLPKVLAGVDANTRIYVCGPDRLLQGVQDAARELGLARDQVHSESFS